MSIHPQCYPVNECPVCVFIKWTKGSVLGRPATVQGCWYAHYSETHGAAIHGHSRSQRKRDGENYILYLHTFKYFAGSVTHTRMNEQLAAGTLWSSSWKANWNAPLGNSISVHLKFCVCVLRMCPCVSFFAPPHSQPLTDMMIALLGETVCVERG